jgi:flagellar motor component MotA
VGGGEGSMIGAVLGLIQVMQQLDNVTEEGRGIAVAFMATIYGSLNKNSSRHR